MGKKDTKLTQIGNRSSDIKALKGDCDKWNDDIISICTITRKDKDSKISTFCSATTRYNVITLEASLLFSKPKCYHIPVHKVLLALQSLREEYAVNINDTWV